MQDLLELAIEKTRAFIDEKYHYEDEYNVIPVWYCKTLQNYKCILIDNRPNQLLYEVSYNGDKQEWYIDEYAKITNKLVK